jgi:hypothetical protein
LFAILPEFIIIMRRVIFSIYFLTITKAVLMLSLPIKP